MRDLSQLSREQIADNLSQYASQHLIEDPFPKRFFNTSPREASVLVALFQQDDNWHMLYIRRTEHKDDRHSGQVAFPGGKVDDIDEDNIAAALRECEEEIGIGREKLSVLGCLNDYRTVSNFLVTPVVALMEWPVKFVPDSVEVDRIFSIPLSWLCTPENLKIEQRELTGFGSTIPVYHYQPYDGEVLWGITAKITVSLLTTLQLL